MKTAWMWNYSLLAAALVLTTGCAKFDLRKNIPWGEGRDGTIEQPLRVEVAWVDTVLSKPNEKPIRGFGGRLYFFGPNNSQESVKVEGTLVVYTFNETNRDPTNVVPDRKIVYAAKDFETLYSKTKLGHSYSVWVPWDEAGGPRAKISLIVRFIPTKGAAITSEQMTVVLPGPEPLIDVQQVTGHRSADPSQLAAIHAGGSMPANGPVQQASYQQPVAGGLESSGIIESSAKSRQLSSHTIPLRGSQAHYFMQRENGLSAAPIDGSTPSIQSIAPSASPAPESAVPAPRSLPHAAQQQAQGPVQPATTTAQPPLRSGPWKHQARAALAAPPRFWRDQLLQRPAEWQSYLASPPSPATAPGPHGSVLGAEPSSTPQPIDLAVAHQNRP